MAAAAATATLVTVLAEMGPVPAPTTHRRGQTNRLARVNRLRRRQDFVAVLRNGRRVRHRLLVLGIRPNGGEDTRVGFAVGRRVGNAVTRNRIRRRLREIVRALPLARGFDVVITARPDAASATFDELQAAFKQSAGRGELLLRESR